MIIFRNTGKFKSLNDRLIAENESLKAMNKQLQEENKKLVKSTDNAVRSAKVAKEQAEKLKIIYEANLQTAKEAQEKYHELYKQCFARRLELERDLKKYNIPTIN